MSLPKLYYDPHCIVCNSFAKLLSKHLHNAVELCAMEPTQAQSASEFCLQRSDGTQLYGTQAIQELERIVPAIRQFFWMLPDRYRGKALIQSYRFGKWLRKLWGCRQCS